MNIDMNADEIQGQTFRGGLFGYKKVDVKDFLRQLSKAWTQLKVQNKELTTKCEGLQKELDGWRAREKEIFDRTHNSQIEAASIREHAAQQAEKLMLDTEERAAAIRTRTEAWLEEVIAKVEETQRQKQNFLTAFRSALDSHYALIETEEDETEPLTAGLSTVLRSDSNASL